jgi:peptidoglycan hydrolase-like protein with peptidoglycan-binding domain
LEVTIATLLVGVLLVGSMNTVGTLVLKHGLQAQGDVKLVLAHHLLSEIQQAAFEDPEGSSGLGTDAGEQQADREDFDDVDDYHEWSETEIHNRQGRRLPGYAGFRRSVKVEPVRSDDPQRLGTLPCDLKRITVTVIGPDRTQRSMSALRGRFSPLDVEPGVRSSYVRSIQLRLRQEGASYPLDAGTPILNQVAAEETP